MRLLVNGETRELTAPDGRPAVVRDLLVQCGWGERPCAVEVNRSLVPRASHGSAELHEGDRVEVVTLVGGG